MTIISDDLFADKLKQLQALKDEINQDREEIHKVMGEWLANALGDDDNHELQAIFLDSHDNTQYLKIKRHRELLVPIAQKLEGKLKVIQRNFSPQKTTPDNQNSQDHLLFNTSLEE